MIVRPLLQNARGMNLEFAALSRGAGLILEGVQEGKSENICLQWLGLEADLPILSGRSRNSSSGQ